MKSFLLISFFVSVFITACNKEPIENSSTPNPFPIPVTPIFKSPNVHAGSDIYIVFPANSITLKGSAEYPEKIQSVSWKLASGHGSIFIDNSASFETKVLNLLKGVYLFEFKGIDKLGLVGTDTVSVHVLEKGSGNNEIIFKDVQWNCPLGCNLGIENFYNYVPMGIAFKVYVKRDNSTQWVEYVDWNIYQTYLEIFVSTELWPDDTPDVKIVY